MAVGYRMNEAIGCIYHRETIKHILAVVVEELKLAPWNLKVGCSKRDLMEPLRFTSV